MYSLLFLFCLYFYFGISTRLLTEHPYAERPIIDTGRLEPLEYSRNERNSAGHWGQAELSNSGSKSIRRSKLEARAGGATALAVVDKQFEKKMRKAATRWKKSPNSKALNELFSQLMASPLIEITRCHFIMVGNTQHNLFIDHLAALESLLPIIVQRFKIPKSKVYITDYHLEEHDRGILERRGYTILNPENKPFIPNYSTPTTFIFNSHEAPQLVAGSASGIHGDFPPIYLGISPRFIIEDTMKRPQLYRGAHSLYPQALGKAIREDYLRPFVKNRPYQNMVSDPTYTAFSPPMAVFWKGSKTDQPTSRQGMKDPVAGNEAENTENALAQMQLHGEDEGSSAGPSAGPSAQEPSPGQVKLKEDEGSSAGPSAQEPGPGQVKALGVLKG